MTFTDRVVSKIIFLIMDWRILFRKAVNAYRRKKNEIRIQNLNNATTHERLSCWLDRGFKKLNVGGGSKNLKGFLNVDFVSHKCVEREIVANILDLSFIPSDSIYQIHSNHVIEHLTDDQLSRQLQEYNRILVSGGLLTLRCPNGLGICYGLWFDPILEKEREQFVALGFPEDENFGETSDKWMHKSFFGFLHWLWGDMGNIQNQHLSIITPTKLESCLKSANFDILKLSSPEAVNLVVVAKK